MKYFALSTNDGLLYSLGKHESWDSAESLAQSMNLEHIWLIDETDAKSWVDYIKEELAK